MVNFDRMINTNFKTMGLNNNTNPNISRIFRRVGLPEFLIPSLTESEIQGIEYMDKNIFDVDDTLLDDSIRDLINLYLDIKTKLN